MSDDRSKRGPQASSPFPMSRLSAPITLLDAAREIQAADSMLTAVVGGKLESIARQIRALQQEAQQALEQARVDAELHRATCQFKKIPGRIYHLYARPNGDRYFSLLSPADWNDAPPHAFQGSYRLEADMSFTPAEQVERREQEWSQLRPLLSLTPPRE
jgi:hypothetical protein